MGIKKETGEERQFDTGAKKQAAAGKGTPVLVPGDAILDIAKHFEEGAAVHGDRNWEKGIPLSELLNSAERHLQQLKMGMTDESHERAFAWNAIVYLATKLRIEAGILPKELDDMPRYEVQENRFSEYIISRSGSLLGWYIIKNGAYLWKDLTFHLGSTGAELTGKLINNYGEPSGYYKTKKLAEETLQAYLDKELDDMPRYEKIETEQHTFTYMCDDCQNRFDTPIIGKLQQGTNLLLNGCPECGCSSYTRIGDFPQYPDLCGRCAERMRNAKMYEPIELCKICSERKV